MRNVSKLLIFLISARSKNYPAVINIKGEIQLAWHIITSKALTIHWAATKPT